MKAKILAILNSCLWFVFLLLMLTGLIMKFRVSPEDGANLMWHGFSYQEIGEFHFYVACTVISLIFIHLWLNRSWLIMWLKKKRMISLLIAIIGLLIPLVVFAEPVSEEFSGSYTATGSVSTLETPITSLGHRLDFTFKPNSFKGRFEYRAESYTESSFHGAGGSLVNEHKLETQLNYIYPISRIFSANAGLLYHRNNTFQDTYYWAIVGVSATIPLTDKTTVTTSISAENKTSGGRIFYDANTSLTHQISSKFSAFGNLHRYENLGEFDNSPSQKLEYELGVSSSPNTRFDIALSYLRHSQYNDPNDRFASLRLRFAVHF